MHRDNPDMPNVDQAKLDSIAESFSAAIRSGNAPEIDQYVNQYPEAGNQLRNLLTSIAMIEGLKPGATSESDNQNAERLAIEHLDEYKIVREIGRGGMGIVCEAIHQSLGRRVAIKILASGLLGDSKHLARFRREARAAAKLRHSNIVPVFGVGQSDNHHYYVMDYIDGISLRQLIGSIREDATPEMHTVDLADTTTDDTGRIHSSAEGALCHGESKPNDVVSVASRTGTDCRWAAGIGATLCDALEYAHSQGVLHRDIKPANALIDRKGVVWIADFGLAKLTEQPAMTATGDIVGTPQYMAPESFEGRFDVRSEIYAVGLMLYELLTLQPAIDGKSPGDVIRKATAGHFIRPRLLRTDLPRDLETIVLKCLSHDPSLRYQTAGQVRDDLRRFLADRPIAARRTGVIGRAVRWTRRDPLVASLTFATFGLLLALAVVSAIGFVRTSNALADASRAQRTAESLLIDKTAALEAAENQRQRAEGNLQVALAAFDAIMQNITDRGIKTDEDSWGEITESVSPNVTPDDALLLQSLLGFFDQLGDNNSEDMLPESALAARRAGEIYQRLGQLKNADRAYGESLQRYRVLDKRNPGDVELVIAQAEIQNEIAVIAGLRGQLGRADQMSHQTLSLLTGSSETLETDHGNFLLARAHRLFASMRARAGMDGWNVRLPFRAPQRPRRTVALFLKNRIEQELSATEEAIRILGELGKQHPENLSYQVELARAYRDQAKVAALVRRKREAETAIRKSIELFENLLRDNRDSDAIRYELAVTLSSTAAFGTNMTVRAMRAAELSKTLLADTPDQPRYQALRAHTLTSLARFQQRAGNSNRAADSLDEAIRIYDSLASKAPEMSLYVARRAQVLDVKSELQHRNGETAEAIETLEREIRRLEMHDRRSNPSRAVRIQLQSMKQKLNRLKNSG